MPLARTVLGALLACALFAPGMCRRRSDRAGRRMVGARRFRERRGGADQSFRRGLHHEGAAVPGLPDRQRPEELRAVLRDRRNEARPRRAGPPARRRRRRPRPRGRRLRPRLLLCGRLAWAQPLRQQPQRYELCGVSLRGRKERQAEIHALGRQPAGVQSSDRLRAAIREGAASARSTTSRSGRTA